MTIEQVKDLRFYCWQLGIETLGQLFSFKREHECFSNDDLLVSLIAEYNHPQN